MLIFNNNFSKGLPHYPPPKYIFNSTHNKLAPRKETKTSKNSDNNNLQIKFEKNKVNSKKENKEKNKSIIIKEDISKENNSKRRLNLMVNNKEYENKLSKKIKNI